MKQLERDVRLGNDVPRSNLIRITRILGCFDVHNTPKPTYEILEEVRIGRSTGFGLLRAMVLRGWLERVDHGQLRLGPKAAGLAFTPLETRENSKPTLASGSRSELRAHAEKATPLLEWDPRLAETVSTLKFRKSPPFNIGYANASLSNNWRKAMLESMRYGVRIHSDQIDRFLIKDADDDVDVQISQIDDLVEEGINLLLLSAASLKSPALDQKLSELANLGIPVIAVDRRPEEASSFVSFVTASDRRIGRVSAQWLAERLGGSGIVWMLSGLEGASPAMRRQAAALAVFSEFPGIRVEAVAYTNWTEAGGYAAVERLVQGGAKMPDGIWCDSGLQGVGSLKYFTEQSLPVPAHTGGDLNKMYKLALHHKVPFVALDYPAAMGARALDVALDVLSGKSVTRRVEVPVPVVLPRGLETRSIKADVWAERHVGWDLPDTAILSQGPSLRRGAATMSAMWEASCD